jgi:glycosyltransferase involved in cell wall biosynthesis
VKNNNYGPEVVYFSGLSLRYLRLAVEMSRYFDIPMVILHMDDWMEKEKRQMKELGWIWHKFIVKYMKMAASRSLSNTTNSPALARKISELTGYEHKAANNCCEDLIKKNAPPAIRSNAVPVITYAGAMNWDLQGETLEFFSHAVAELNAEGIKVHLHIYAPWEFAPKANAIEIPNAVSYKGHVSKYDLINIYLQSDFLLTTTTFRKENLILFRHSLSTKLSEYLCVGKPVISVGRYSWHLHEYVENNGCGFTIKQKELVNIKRRLIDILSVPKQETLKIGKNNRSLWEKAHDVRVMARETRKALGLGEYPDE